MNLSHYLAELLTNETLLLCNRNRPVAELRLLSQKVPQKPRIGAAKGKFAIPKAFFDPLPDEIVKAFGGE